MLSNSSSKNIIFNKTIYKYNDTLVLLNEVYFKRNFFEILTGKKSLKQKKLKVETKMILNEIITVL